MFKVLFLPQAFKLFDIKCGGVFLGAVVKQNTCA